MIKRFNTKKSLLIFLLTVALFISGCGLLTETWTGVYYPNGCLFCQDKYIYSPTFFDRASCLAWATDLKQRRHNTDDKFECGKNCKPPKTKDDLYICEETVDY